MSSGQQPPWLPAEESDLHDAQLLCTKVFRRGTLALNQWERERLTRHLGRMPESKKQALADFLARAAKGRRGR